MQIDDDDIESLNAKVLMALSEVNDSEAAAERLLETKSSGTDKLVSAKDFICALSKINIVNNLLFARAWQRYCKGSTPFHDSIGQHSMTGNSRDDPTPIEHSCKKSKGCPFKSIRSDVVTYHEIRCNEAYARKVNLKHNMDKKFACPWDGCSRAFIARTFGKKLLVSCSDWSCPRMFSCDDGR
ncbi:hypothetical protein V1506DRAFT_90465 [Lipomyces tetrasporus]